MFQIFADNSPIYTPTGIDDTFKVLNPVLTQEVNMAGQLTFEMPVGNAGYLTLRQLVTPITVYKDEREIFFGRVLEVSRDFYNHKTVECEGALAFLNDVIIRPFEFRDETKNCVRNYLNYILNLYNAGVEEWKQIRLGEVTVKDSNGYIYRYKESYSTAFEVLEDHTINSTLGGYLSIRREYGVSYLDYKAESGRQSNQYIEYGKNLVDLLHRTSATGLYTVLIPLGADVDNETVTISSVNGGKDYIESAEGIAAYGRIWAVKKYDDITKPAELLKAGRNDLAMGINESVALELSAVDLSSIGVDTDSLNCGDYVPVYSVPHGVNTRFILNRVELSLTNPEDSIYQMGAARTGLIDRQLVYQRGTSRAAEATTQTAVAADGAAQAAANIAREVRNTVVAIEQSRSQGIGEASVEAGNYADVDIEFSFLVVPIVILQNMSENEDIVLSVIAVSEYGFTARIYNKGASDADVTFSWFAQV